MIAPESGLPFQRVNQIPAPQVAEWLGLDRGRERYKYRCPVHGGTSLHAYPAAGDGFACFACDPRPGQQARHYSNVDLVMAARGWTPVEACRELARAFAVPLPEAGYRSPSRSRRPTEARKRTAPPSVPELPAVAALRAEGATLQEPPAVYAAVLDALGLTLAGTDYLAGRGFDPVQAARYGFRAVDGPQGWDELREGLGGAFLLEELAIAGLASPKDRDDPASPLVWRPPYRGPALVIPYLRRGETVSLRFRNLGPAEPRYQTLARQQLPAPFNADAIDAARGGELHVCEGEFNAYALALHGHHAIGLPGAQGWRDEWVPLVRDAARLVAWLDDDPEKQMRDGQLAPGAGENGRRHMADSLLRTLGRAWMDERVRSCTIRRDGDRVRDLNDLHREHQLDRLLDDAPWRA